MTGTDILHVAYKGSTGARNDIDRRPRQHDVRRGAVGRAQRAGGTGSRAGRHRQAKRASALPNVPTVSETVPGYEHTGWFGLMVPAGTPKADHRQAQCRDPGDGRQAR